MVLPRYPFPFPCQGWLTLWSLRNSPHWCWWKIRISHFLLTLYSHRGWLPIWSLRFFSHWLWWPIWNSQPILSLYHHWGLLTICCPIIHYPWVWLTLLLFPTAPSNTPCRGRFSIWIIFITVSFVTPWRWLPVWFPNPDCGLIYPWDCLP